MHTSFKVFGVIQIGNKPRVYRCRSRPAATGTFDRILLHVVMASLANLTHCLKFPPDVPHRYWIFNESACDVVFFHVYEMKKLLYFKLTHNQGRI